MGIALLPALLLALPPVVDDPAWIWCREEARDDEVFLVERTFELEAPPALARLWATADNHVEARLNGVLVLESSSWKSPVTLDVAEHLRAGTNELVVWAKNDGGPGGLAFELDWGRDAVRSDGTERVLEPVDGTSVLLGPVGSTDPWGELAEAVPPSPSVALDASAIRVPDGFEVERLLSSRRARQGSWVSLIDAPDGHLWLSSQAGGLFRVSVDDGGPARLERAPLELPGAQGLCFANDTFYAVVNARDGKSGLYTLIDEDADGLPDRSVRLKKLEGDGEHGPHAVVPTPDGRGLYVIAGNYTKTPFLDASYVPRLWQQDRSLPRFNDPSGHAAGKRAPAGWIARTDFEGRHWTLVVSGLRNAYDVAFDPRGEAYTFDSDMEYDVGLPWYRPTRVLHAFPGAQFGWRTGSHKWPVRARDKAPSALEAGRGSPTGIVFGTRSHFPAPWRDALFLGDWTDGRILAAFLDDRGTKGRYQEFLSGKPLPITDLAFGSDGALYFVTGGRGLQSGLYRVRWTGLPTDTEPTTWIDPSTLERRRLENLDRPDPELAWQHLDAADRTLRFAARTALERRPTLETLERAWKETRSNARAEALLLLIRAGAAIDPRMLPAILELETDPPSWIRLLELALVRGAEPTDRQADEAAAKLLEFTTYDDEPLVAEAIRLLAALGAPGLDAVGIPLLEAATTQEHAIALAFALAHWDGAWTTEHWERFATWLESAPDTIQGGESCREYLERIRETAYASVGLEWVDETEATTEEVAGPGPAIHAWTVDEVTKLVATATGGQGDVARGRALYERTTCHTCHRIGNDGGGTGPDLTTLASRLGGRDLAIALVEPSRDVSDQYVDTEYWIDDELVVGRLIEETDEIFLVRTSPDDVEVEVEKSLVTLTRPHEFSRMPNGLLDPLEGEEIVDLVAYLLRHDE